MLMAGLFGLIAFVSLLFAIYVRLQPPTVIRVAADGEATVVGGRLGSGSVTAGLLKVLAGAQAGEAAPTDIEGRAAVRKFLESYLRYTPTQVDKNFADALNMMTQNLRIYCLDQLRDQDLIGKIKDEQITSSFKIRSIEPVPGQPWTYQAFGVKEVHRIRNKSEFTDKIVGKYHVRLIQDRRSERVPSGGDPRGGNVDMVDWIESIPISETRNYVQHVLENLQIYRGQIGRNSAFSLVSDLAR